MSLLELAGVSKSYGRGAHKPVALDNVSLQIEAGELVAVWGLRHSGRSTLLRVAAGVESPDSGSVRFCEQENVNSRNGALHDGVAYCRKTFSPGDGRVVFDHLLSAQEALGVPRRAAVSRAREALRRAEADRCATLRPEDLDSAEAVRVALARALALRPKLLVIDEPTVGVELVGRDSILRILRSVADNGVAVLMSTGDTPCLSVADRALTIGSGILRGQVTPRIAPVIALRSQAQPAA
jgi:ABC-type multidrug transport system ATPase subunit